MRAVTAAWKYACNSKIEDGWGYKVYDAWKEEDYKYDEGRAFAKAIAVARATCTSSGNAYGCAAAYANAKAWSKATVSAHAKAWADAIAQCKCDGKTQTAEASASAYASEFRTLIAKVEALASAHVCVHGDDYASEYDAQTCLQDIYATVFAKVRPCQSRGWCPSFFKSCMAGAAFANRCKHVAIDQRGACGIRMVAAVALLSMERPL
jgi:dGTP triphosphohydrolase